MFVRQPVILVTYSTSHVFIDLFHQFNYRRFLRDATRILKGKSSLMRLIPRFSNCNPCASFELKQPWLLLIRYRFRSLFKVALWLLSVDERWCSLSLFAWTSSFQNRAKKCSIVFTCTFFSKLRWVHSMIIIFKKGKKAEAAG